MKRNKLFILALTATLLMGSGGAGARTAFAETVKDEKYYQTEFDNILKNDVVKIKSLIEECNIRGISTDYETANLRILELFVPFGINDASENKLTAQERNLWMSKYVGYGDESQGNDKTERAQYILDELKKCRRRLFQHFRTIFREIKFRRKQANMLQVRLVRMVYHLRQLMRAEQIGLCFLPATDIFRRL